MTYRGGFQIFSYMFMIFAIVANSIATYIARTELHQLKTDAVELGYAQWKLTAKQSTLHVRYQLMTNEQKIKLLVERCKSEGFLLTVHSGADGYWIELCYIVEAKRHFLYRTSTPYEIAEILEDMVNSAIKEREQLLNETKNILWPSGSLVASTIQGISSLFRRNRKS